MNIKPFKVEEWMNELEAGAKYNIAETCVNSISPDELFELSGEDRTAFIDRMMARRLTYGDIEGMPEFRAGVCKLYRSVRPDEVVPTHGAAGANHHVFYSLINPGDRVISIMPTYQQLYSIPEGYGAEMHLLQLKAENGYLPDLDELRRLAIPGTKLICINNPNNPTGALMPSKMLKQIVEIAHSVDAWILCDEVYRHLTQEDVWCDSIVDLYEKGISVSGMSKVFSAAGLRLGWIATHDQNVIRSVLSHRDYNLISCGMLDETFAALILQNSDRVLARNRSIVRTNLAILDNWMKTQPHLCYVKPQAGTTALIYYDLDIPSRAFCREMYDRTGAFVTPGECFEIEYSFRIGYACGQDELCNGLAAIDEYIRMKLTEGVQTRQ